jgi:hypothetical protein
MREVPRVHNYWADSSSGQHEVVNCDLIIEQPSGVADSKMPYS